MVPPVVRKGNVMADKKPSKKSDLELFEEALKASLNRAHHGTVKAKEGGYRTPRITIKMSCKRYMGLAAPVIVSVTVETISEFEAKLKAEREASKAGFGPHECVVIAIEKENF